MYTHLFMHIHMDMHIYRLSRLTYIKAQREGRIHMRGKPLKCICAYTNIHMTAHFASPVWKDNVEGVYRRANVHIYTWYVLIRIHVHIYMCIYTCSSAFRFAYIKDERMTLMVYTLVHKYIYTYVHTHMCICIYTCIGASHVTCIKG